MNTSYPRQTTGVFGKGAADQVFKAPGEIFLRTAPQLQVTQQSSWDPPKSGAAAAGASTLLLMAFDFDCTIAAIHVFEEGRVSKLQKVSSFFSGVPDVSGGFFNWKPKGRQPLWGLRESPYMITRLQRRKGTRFKGGGMSFFLAGSGNDLSKSRDA